MYIFIVYFIGTEALPEFSNSCSYINVFKFVRFANIVLTQFSPQKRLFQAWKRTQWVKSLLCKHENPSVDPNTNIKDGHSSVLSFLER